MATGIKISELAEQSFSDDTTKGLQKLFIAHGNNNYQVPLSVLSTEFITRDFAAATSELSSSWNYCDVGTLANDPVLPIDVANGNTLSGLQDIFDRLSGIWNIRTRFRNEYEAKITVVNTGYQWITREKPNSDPKYISVENHVDVYDAVGRNFPKIGVNLIGPEGGYVFLKELNPRIKENVYMNAGDEYSDEIFEKLGLVDGVDTVQLTRYEITRNCPVGVTFHCAYHAYGEDEGYAKKHDFSYTANVTIKYAGIQKTGEIKYYGGPNVHTKDSSPHRDNHHWGEGDPAWPDATGGNWYNHRNNYLSVTNVSGDVKGMHGIFIEAYDYCVRAIVQKVTLSRY